MSGEEFKAENDKRIKRNKKKKYKPSGSMSEQIKNMRINKGKMRMPKKISKDLYEDV